MIPVPRIEFRLNTRKQKGETKEREMYRRYGECDSGNTSRNLREVREAAKGVGRRGGGGGETLQRRTLRLMYVNG